VVKAFVGKHELPLVGPALLYRGHRPFSGGYSDERLLLRRAKSHLFSKVIFNHIPHRSVTTLAAGPHTLQR
jgi:hypothetical protein